MRSTTPLRPFRRVLDGLRREIVYGRRAPGEPLVVAEVAAAYRSSATPVREALAHLAGEGLVEESSGRGYACRRLDAREHRALCDLQEMLLGASTRDRQPTEMAPDAWMARFETRRQLGADAAELTAWLFEAFAAAAHSAPLVEAQARVGGRLGAARRVEAELLPQVGAELEALARSFAHADGLKMLTRLRDYHDRRRAISEVICDTLRMREGSSKDEV